MTQDSLYVIGIGGTGAKCLESIIHLSSVGLFTDQPIHLLFVDADETNGNLERARGSLRIYQECHHLLVGDNYNSPWMKTHKSYNQNNNHHHDDSDPLQLGFGRICAQSRSTIPRVKNSN